ncbi:glycoside hydrolase family 88/105 protein [Catenovulum adriaticum]|uniref:Glycoside hydrolase family 88 protein n=1 Tax=Catenovulum adriaticum TaxID=2984846 RepID=A0ABY7ARJ5_9ALTE|nr:glycoside hydrolase family 88 protein [Catenovulum sp. TS8]WAJ72172.1 glycoside hydrolase family 88 protein [Catenovulum sp. TS8]
MSDKYLSLLQQLSSGLCSLKGIGNFNPFSNEAIRIEFEEWEWEIGVGLYGLYQYANDANQANLIDALENWFERQIDKGLPQPQINTTAPMITLALLAEQKQRTDWHQLIAEWADYLLTSLPRVEGCGFQHVVKERLNEGQLWDDTLFMTGLFLAKAGMLLNRQDLIEEAELQFLAHAQFLADKKTGLWFHGWTAVDKHNFAQAFWARGNAWITVAIPELIQLVGEVINPAIKQHLISLLNMQIQALLKLQSENGMWHTVLDDDMSPQESSAVAGICYGMLCASRLNLINPEDVEQVKQSALKGVQAIVDRIDERGILLEASDGTAMGHDIQYYFDIPNTPVPYGQALAMMCITEVIKGEWIVDSFSED